MTDIRPDHPAFCCCDECPPAPQFRDRIVPFDQMPKTMLLSDLPDTVVIVEFVAPQEFYFGLGDGV